MTVKEALQRLRRILRDLPFAIDALIIYQSKLNECAADKSNYLHRYIATFGFLGMTYNPRRFIDFAENVECTNTGRTMKDLIEKSPKAQKTLEAAHVAYIAWTQGRSAALMYKLTN
jgi:hypothetical protein